VTEPEPLEWRVLIEETEGLSRENRRMTITRGWCCATHDEAMRNALEVAQTHQPEHPLAPRGRAVYQVGEDTWLVRVFGRTRNYHFRVIVARLTSDNQLWLVVTRRALVLAGLAAVAWSAARVVLLLTGHGDLVVTAGDTHGYQAIFSLLLLPPLVLAGVTVATEVRHPTRPWRIAPGVALTLSAPLSGELAIATVAIGAALTATALLGRRRPTNG